MKTEKLMFGSGSLLLEGRLTLPEGRPGPFPAAVICHPHPRLGGSMDNNVVMALEQACRDRGIMSLAFNFRGVGRSQGQWDEMRGEVDDVVSALSCLVRREETDPRRVGLAGYSFGGLMALYALNRIEEEAERARQERGPGEHFRPKALVLVSPMPPNRGWNADSRLSRIFANPCPSLIITGTQDRFASVHSMKELSVAVGPEARLSLMEGVDHFYLGHESELSARAGDFLAEILGV